VSELIGLLVRREPPPALRPSPRVASESPYRCAVYLRCISMTRTQIYLPAELRQRVDERADAEGKAMAEVVREALEHYLAQPLDSVQDLLEDTFGSVVDAWAPPRDEWDRV
jgi:Ribbon-helix-helix protein, copG family